MNNAREFTVRLADLLRREHAAMADFLAALADFDRKQLWIELGYASLFDYLHRELGLSKGAAHYRKVAADLARRHPEVLDALRDGRLCITSVVHLAKVLTPENRHEVLPRFFHRSRREAMELAAEILPAAAAPRREVVTSPRASVAAPPPSTASSPAAAPARKGSLAGALDTGHRSALPFTAVRSADLGQLPVQPAELRVDRAQGPVQPDEPGAGSVAADEAHGLVGPFAASPPPPAPPARRDDVEPLTSDLRRLHVSVSRRFLAKLETARAALSHSRPGAGAEQILEAGLDLLLAQHAKRKGLVAKPRKEQPRAAQGSGDPEALVGEPTPSSESTGASAATDGSRRFPAHVRRAIWLRDGGRCQWPLESGGVCGSTFQVELDHVQPRARGGPSTVENGRLACVFHNRLSARLAFGDAWMDRFLQP